MERRNLRAACLLVLVGACWSVRAPGLDRAPGSRSFRSRTQAIDTIDRLLRNREWEELASYYDLRGSSIASEDLRTGEYFHNNDRGSRSSGEANRLYWRPFAPGAHFDHEMADEDPDVVVVVMVFDPPTGSGSGKSSVYRFRLKRNGWGWQLVPDESGKKSW